MTRPVIVQHYAGVPGASGPATAAERILRSRLAMQYQFVPMRQLRGNGLVDVPLIRAWIRMLRETRPDIVHIRGLQNEGFHAAVATRLAGCPRVLVTVHGTVRDLQFGPRSLRRKALTQLAEPFTLRSATHVATVSQRAAHRGFLEQFAGKFAGVVPNGVPVPKPSARRRSAARRQHRFAATDFVMVTASRLTWEKGYRSLADAMRLLPRAEHRRRLLVLGDGADAAGIRADFASVTGTEVRFVGQCNDVASYLAAADVFVFPTLHENLSNALLEAMAHGLPAVATAVGGNVEILKRGGGLLVPAQAPVAIANAVTELERDPATRERLGSQARQVVRDHYSLDHMIDTLDGLYQQMLVDRP
ncbi:glycosyltransferase family 4 protein [Dactylosporangium sp. NBC_01737]|uniref:glycosyltransferase family 4 protein n=1 Tax=Dactylosporangium sp. NBC_01737 TaxID=2975959 RepID=UPI002E144B25|nr:glycosyltransferase family 4 protein [Dactylosporangium sp. NBC_01737]